LGRDTHDLFSVQEDPGESLSDCEKDSDEIMEEDAKITDDEDEDSFVVPDGYLSDNEV
jgi:chromatin assembly factor 1 subunit A